MRHRLQLQFRHGDGSPSPLAVAVAESAGLCPGAKVKLTVQPDRAFLEVLGMALVTTEALRDMQ